MWFRVIVEFLQLISIVRQANVCGLQKHATHWQQEPYRFTPHESTLSPNRDIKIRPSAETEDLIIFCDSQARSPARENEITC